MNQKCGSESALIQETGDKTDKNCFKIKNTSYKDWKKHFCRNRKKNVEQNMLQ